MRLGFEKSIDPICQWVSEPVASRSRIFATKPEQEKTSVCLKYEFTASTKKLESEGHIVGIRLALAMNVKQLMI